MEIEHDVRTVGNFQPASVVNSLRIQIIEFLQQSGQMNHDTVTQNTGGLGVEHARWKEVERKLLALNNHGMTSV